MKRLLALLITVCLAWSCAGSRAEESAASAEDPEITFALETGLIDEWHPESADRSITAQEFYAMAEQTIQILDSTKVEEFLNVYPKARQSEKAITRYDAMVIVLAVAETLDILTLNNEYWGDLHRKIGDDIWNQLRWNTVLFGSGNESKPVGQADRYTYAYFYSFGRKCLVHDQYLFDYDPKSNSMRPREKITYREALLALARLAESEKAEVDVSSRDRRGLYSKNTQDNLKAASLLRDSKYLDEMSDAGQETVQRMNERISEIKKTPSEIVKAKTYVPGVSYSGTAWYVDREKGKDNRNGKSPKTAVASYFAIENKVRYGDAVFFRRGQVHSYPDMIQITDGVTYSAYGEGYKPVLTCSPMNLNNTSAWELYYEKDGVKIWHAIPRNFGSVGWIDFNLSDDLFAYPVFEYWSPEDGYQFVETVHRDYSSSVLLRNGINQDDYGKLVTLPIEEELTENLTFVSRVDYADQQKTDIPLYDYRGTDLYLRCDDGNPAEVFSMIKITDGSRVGPLQTVGSDHVTLDNLNICNGSQWGVGHMKHATIQNCEIGWIGNEVGEIRPWNGRSGIPIGYIGDCIYCSENGSVIRNNYLHHACCCGVVVEEEETALEPLTVSSNVISKTGIGYVWMNNSKWRKSSQEVTVSDNIIGFQGEFDGILRWNNDFSGILIRVWGDQDWIHGTAKIAAQHMFINNTVIGGYDASVRMTAVGLYALGEFSGNVFVGKPDNHLMVLDDSMLSVDYRQVLGMAESE